MSKPKTRSDNAVNIARREKQILGEATAATYLYASMELLVEIRDLLRKASGK